MRMCALLSLLISVLLAGCMTTPEYMSVYSPATPDSCTYVQAHYKSTGEYVEGSYSCPTSSPHVSYSANLCSWVDGYTRKDGTVVAGHTRCKHNYSPSSTYSTSGTSSGGAPCITSYCGPVHVKGYYRKDGTYVRPYTRRR